MAKRGWAKKLLRKNKLKVAKKSDAITGNSMIYAAFSITSLAGATFFLSPAITGDVVAGSDIKLNIGIGALMFIIGLVLGFFFFRNKRK